MQSTTRLGRQPEPLADRAKDPAVRLVVDEQIDVVERHVGGLGGLRVASVRRATASRNVSWPRIRITPSARSTVMCRRRRRPLQARSARSGRSSGRLQHDRAGAVGEHRRGRAVGGVGDPRHQVGADRDRAAGPAGFDLRGGRPRAPRESRCRPSRRRTRRHGWRRSGARPAAPRSGISSSDVVVATSTRSTSSGSTPARASASSAALRGVDVEALVRLGDPARADAGAPHDPVVARPRGGRRSRHCDDVRGQADADRGDRRAAGLGRDREVEGGCRVRSEGRRHDVHGRGRRRDVPGAGVGSQNSGGGPDPAPTAPLPAPYSPPECASARASSKRASGSSSTSPNSSRSRVIR